LLVSILDAYSNPYLSLNAPLWWKSSPIHMSDGDACGDAALNAGCGSSSAIAVVQPSYETP
jgi:hypothetical protein